MHPKMRAGLLWTAAIIITLASIVYQRRTGPTYPVDGELVHVMDVDRRIESRIQYSLPTSAETGEDTRVFLDVQGAPVRGILKWKRHKSNDDWTHTRFERNGQGLAARMPSQPKAGKLVYFVQLEFEDGHQEWLRDEPVIIRYKGRVPPFVLVPHILLMFTSMLVSTRTGLAAWWHSPASIRYAWISFVTLILGGMILGPMVQKYAFDAFWTGWPFGNDLTDNKTLIAVLGWAAALWRYRQKGKARGWFMAAAVIQLLVYLIPHSVLGSELDYTQIES